jgi:phospholipase/carboxylesterase
MSASSRAQSDAWLDAVGALVAPLLRLLAGLEEVARHLHPPSIAALRERIAPDVEALVAARGAFEAEPVPDGFAPLAAALRASSEAAIGAGRLFTEEGSPQDAVPRVLAAMRAHAEAQARLFPLADVLPPVHRFFLEPAARERSPLPEPTRAGGAAPGEGSGVGLFRASNGSDERGGFTLFAPRAADDAPRPLVVALHGGSGHGAEFVWTWLREARTRGFLLLAPTSLRSTWSLGGDDVDGPNLRRQLEWVMERWPVDPERVLLTGLSDGATYTLLQGLAEDVPWSALAPISGVFHPLNFVNGNLERARGRRIYLVHGALDWMFPVATAREAARVLEAAGAELVYREIEDLSHAYPREENVRIVEWLDPALAIAVSEAGGPGVS